jgi:hypothetical protein
LRRDFPLATQIQSRFVSVLDLRLGGLNFIKQPVLSLSELPRQTKLSQFYYVTVSQLLIFVFAKAAISHVDGISHFADILQVHEFKCALIAARTIIAAIGSGNPEFPPGVMTLSISGASRAQQLHKQFLCVFL